MVIYMTNMKCDLGQVQLICEIFRDNSKLCLLESKKSPASGDGTLDDMIRLLTPGYNGR